jgi:ribosomal protein L29
MKKNQKLELASLSIDQLNEKVDQYRRDLFSIRLHAMTKPVKDKKSMKKLRKDIARGLTFIQQKHAEV